MWWKRMLLCFERDTIEKKYDPPPLHWSNNSMLDKVKIDDREEQLRKEINVLPDKYKKEFYHISKQRIKDPDTYAVLNFFFPAGLHHFYLGRWLRGIFDFLSLVIGISLLFNNTTLIIGLGFLCVVFGFELHALFQSQLIVQHYNNQIMADSLEEIKTRISVEFFPEKEKIIVPAEIRKEIQKGF
jgi:TM2 domain-containing membrane protein YozV